MRNASQAFLVFNLKFEFRRVMYFIYLEALGNILQRDVKKYTANLKLLTKFKNIIGTSEKFV